MHRKILPRLIFLSLAILMAESAFAGVPAASSKVSVSGTQLMVERRLPNGTLDVARPYVIKGVTWNPATIAPATGRNPVTGNPVEPYGFFFDWNGRNPPGYKLLQYWLKKELVARASQDVQLMRDMNANTVRVYLDFYNDYEEDAFLIAKQILDTFYNNGIMVIMTVAGSKEDIENGRHTTMVNMFKNHPAILMWSLGNEWNFNKYYGYASVSAATAATNLAAQQIKAIDLNHPVSSSLGDKFTLTNNACVVDEAGSNISAIVAACPNVDVWGINVYRGYSFGNIFTQWQGVSAKPFYFSEFGTDSVNTVRFTRLGTPCYPTAGGAPYYSDARVAVSKANQDGTLDYITQSDTALGLWREIALQLPAVYSNKQCLGGLVHEFNDEFWKVGSWHTGLQGLGVANSYELDDYDGVSLSGLPPDGIANEEHFGVVNANRTKKPIYDTLQVYYRSKLQIVFPAVGNRGVYVNNTLTFTVTAKEIEGYPVTLSATGLPAGASFTTITGSSGQVTQTFSWTPTATGSPTVRFLVVSQKGSDYQDVIITVKTYTPPSCFLSGTPILMADGSTKPIEKVGKGESILAFDEATKELKPDKVKQTFRHKTDQYLIVNGNLRVTENHPVYHNGKWVEIGTLKQGDSLLNSDGKTVPITSMTRVFHKAKVYNLEVNPYHTYIAGGIVVHNKLAPPKLPAVN